MYQSSKMLILEYLTYFQDYTVWYFVRNSRLCIIVLGCLAKVDERHGTFVYWSFNTLCV